MRTAFADVLMPAKVEAVCDAERAQTGDERVKRRDHPAHRIHRTHRTSKRDHRAAVDTWASQPRFVRLSPLVGPAGTARPLWSSCALTVYEAGV